MKNKKNGFTLVEMLVCIGIIAALGVVIGLNASDVLKNTQNEDRKAIMDDLFDAAKIYVELSSSTCTKSAEGNFDCTIPLSLLISKGLIEDTIEKELNPMKKNAYFHKNNDKIRVKKDSSTNMVKIASYTCGSNTISDTTLKDYEHWGECI